LEGLDFEDAVEARETEPGACVGGGANSNARSRNALIELSCAARDEPGLLATWLSPAPVHHNTCKSS
jgi:hypothetical protein